MQFRKGDVVAVGYFLRRILSRRRYLLPVGQIYANHPLLTILLRRLLGSYGGFS